MKVIAINGSPRKNKNTECPVYNSTSSGEESSSPRSGGLRGAPEDWSAGYAPMFNQLESVLGMIYGSIKSLKVYNTCQFNNYDHNDMDLFREEDKRKYRDEHFDADKQKAYELGKNIIE